MNLSKKKKKHYLLCKWLYYYVMSEWDILMIFIFDFIFCPDDEEKFAANARSYDYTHIIIIDFKEQEKKYQF